MTALERPDHALVIATRPGETRGALIEQGRLTEMMLLRDGTASRIGEIHRGRVTKVDRRLGAAFIDLGSAGIGFLGFEAGGDGIGEGDSLLVRVERDAADGKLTGLSRRIELGSRNLVLTQGSAGIAISRRIPDAAERFRLKGLLSTWCQPGEGWLARTAATGLSESQLIVEMDRLRSQMAEFSPDGPPTLLHADAGPVERILREMGDPALQAVILDDAGASQRATAWLDHWLPDLVSLVRLEPPPPGHGQEGDLFARLGLEEDIARALDRRVPLGNGGAIAIDITATLTAIDVDMAAAALDPLRLNLSAVEEIARQVRLRDIGGTILIDFLRLRDRDGRQTLQDAVIRAFAGDRLPVQVLGFTRGGLIEVTRPRGRPSLASLLTAPCPSCRGSGRIADPLGQGLLALHQLLAHPTPHRLALNAAPAIVRALEQQAAPVLSEIARKLGRPLPLASRADLAPDRFDLIEMP